MIIENVGSFFGYITLDSAFGDALIGDITSLCVEVADGKVEFIIKRPKILRYR